jgi:hypothetical protein
VGSSQETVRKIKEEEIQRQADERFQKMKLGWEQVDKPEEVSAEAVRELAETLKILSGLGLHAVGQLGPKALMRVNIHTILQEGITKGITTVFFKMVEEESDRKAAIKAKQVLDTRSRSSNADLHDSHQGLLIPSQRLVRTFVI